MSLLPEIYILFGRSYLLMNSDCSALGLLARYLATPDFDRAYQDADGCCTSMAQLQLAMSRLQAFKYGDCDKDLAVCKSYSASNSVHRFLN